MNAATGIGLIAALLAFPTVRADEAVTISEAKKDDNGFLVHEVRPAACREYPHTDKEGFTSRTMLHANNAKDCPAVFWIVEQLRLRARS